ncbi:Leo1-domain-containing protein [Schizophyllum commune Tattone D]|nr:Leo1-domain-containing protein [Schizophyllum commune Tattone D]
MSSYEGNAAHAQDDHAHDDDVDMNALEPKEERDHRGHTDEQSAEEGGADDLFGEDEEEAEAPASPSGGSDRLPTPERERRQALEYTEDTEPLQDQAPVALKEAEVSLPNLPLPRSTDGSTWVVRMPNFLTLDTKPFHPETYEGPENEMGGSAAEIREQSLSIKLKVENTIRWRWAKNQLGEDVRQSNSRIIRWSDGSLSLRLGKELFDIQQTVDNSATTTRQTMGGASQRPSQAPQHTRPQGLTYLVAQHKHSQVLQAEAPITGFMSLTPSDMQSESHRLLVSAVSQKRNKSVRVRMAPDPTVDPEKEKAELIRQDAKKTKRTRSEPRSRRSRRTDDMWSDDDEDEGYAYDEDAGGRRGGGGGGHKKASRTKDDTGGGEYQEDDFVVADESEEEEEPSSKRRRNHDDEDDLDRAERELERRNRDERKQGHKASPQPEESDEGEGDMDVESEEEEDRIRLRRDSRRRVQIEEEEEE